MPPKKPYNYFQETEVRRMLALLSRATYSIPRLEALEHLYEPIRADYAEARRRLRYEVTETLLSGDIPRIESWVAEGNSAHAPALVLRLENAYVV